MVNDNTGKGIVLSTGKFLIEENIVLPANGEKAERIQVSMDKEMNPAHYIIVGIAGNYDNSIYDKAVMEFSVP